MKNSTSERRTPCLAGPCGSGVHVGGEEGRNREGGGGGGGLVTHICSAKGCSNEMRASSRDISLTAKLADRLRIALVLGSTPSPASGSTFTSSAASVAPAAAFAFDSALVLAVASAVAGEGCGRD